MTLFKLPYKFIFATQNGLQNLTKTNESMSISDLRQTKKVFETCCISIQGGKYERGRLDRFGGHTICSYQGGSDLPAGIRRVFFFVEKK